MLKSILLALFVLIISHNSVNRGVNGQEDKNGDNKKEQDLINDLNNKLKLIRDKITGLKQLIVNVKKQIGKEDSMLTNHMNDIEALKKQASENDQHIKDGKEELKKIKDLFDEIQKTTSPNPNTTPNDKKADEAIEKILQKFKDLLEKLGDPKLPPMFYEPIQKLILQLREFPGGPFPMGPLPGGPILGGPIPPMPIPPMPVPPMPIYEDPPISIIKGGKICKEKPRARPRH